MGLIEKISVLLQVYSQLFKRVWKPLFNRHDRTLSLILLAMHETLNETEIEQEVSDLRVSIRYHDHRYYVLNQPEVGDSQYDELMQRLRKLEQNFPQLL